MTGCSVDICTTCYSFHELKYKRKVEIISGRRKYYVLRGLVLQATVKVTILADGPGTREAYYNTGSRPDSRVPEYPLRTLISCKSVAALVSSKAGRGWKNVVPHPMRQKAIVDLPAHFLPATTAASLTSCNASHSISSQSSIFTIFVLADRFQKQLQYSRRAITVHSKNRVKTDIHVGKFMRAHNRRLYILT